MSLRETQPRTRLPLIAVCLIGFAYTCSACTSYDVIRPRASDPEGEVWYLKRRTSFLFFAGSDQLLRCYETKGPETKCVVLRLDEVASTPCLTTRCAGRESPGVSPQPSDEPRREPDSDQPPSRAIILGGKPLFELSAPTTSSLRQLINQRVVLHTVYGKDVKGTLTDVSTEDGLLLQREGATVKYPWIDVHSVWSERP